MAISDYEPNIEAVNASNSVVAILLPLDPAVRVRVMTACVVMLGLVEMDEMQYVLAVALKDGKS